MTSVDSPPNERFSSPITVGNLHTPSSHDVPHHYSQLPPCLALPQSRVTQVLTAGGDALRVLFVAAEKLLAGHEGQLTHVRVIGPYAEVFRGSINVSALSET
jgi:hypothetical protein